MQDREGRRDIDSLVRLLVCPVDKARLARQEETLVCQECGRIYPIEEGIPNLLVEPEE